MSERTSLLGGGGPSPRHGASPVSFFGSDASFSAAVRAALCGRKALVYSDILSPASGVEADLSLLVSSASLPPLGAAAARESLCALWAAALGTATGLPAPEPVSPLWGLLGFQGSDPTRDLRSGSYPLALALAVACLRSSAALRREALLAALGAAPPFALTLLNAVQMLACHLKLLPSTPTFCPCCGAAVRDKEYGRLAAQSHRGASLRGMVELVREAGASAQALPLHSQPPRAGELALGELLTLTMLALGVEWRRQGRGDGGAASESEGALVARVAAAAASGQQAGLAEVRLLEFQGMLSAVQRRVMEALADASLPEAGGRGGGGGGAGSSSSSSGMDAIKRSNTTQMTHLLHGTGSSISGAERGSYQPPALHSSSAGGGRPGAAAGGSASIGTLSPLTTALGGSAGAGSAAAQAALAWGGPAKRALAAKLR